MRTLGVHVGWGGRQLFVANYQTDAWADHGTHEKSFRVFRGTPLPLAIFKNHPAPRHAEMVKGPLPPRRCSFAVGPFNIQRSPSNSQGPRLAFRLWALNVERSGLWGKHLPFFRCSPQYLFPLTRVIIE